MTKEEMTNPSLVRQFGQSGQAQKLSNRINSISLVWIPMEWWFAAIAKSNVIPISSEKLYGSLE